MQLYFVRHGKTEWNLEGRYQGCHGNSPLLPESYEDIKRLSLFLKDTKFVAFYASPLERALQTALKIKENMNIDVPVIADNRLREFDLGELEGMKFSEAERLYPDQIKAFRHEPDLYDPRKFHGESFSHMIKRGKLLIDKITSKYSGNNDKVLLVSHGAALCALIRSLEGYRLADLRKRGGLINTSLTILETKDSINFNELRWNETSYLGRKITSRDSI